MRPSFRHSLALLILLTAPVAIAAADPLPSWNDGPAKRAILEFVQQANDARSPGYIPPAQRIAVFDQDGTLWPEQPVVQVMFVREQLRAKVAQEPSLRQRPAVRAALEGDVGYFQREGPRAVVELLALTFAGLTDEQFETQVRAFLHTAQHPRFQVPYTQTAYAPMLELLAYLRSAGFETWICSGGGADFMRVFASEVYGIPRERVIGSTVKKEVRREGNRLVLVRTAEPLTINDKSQKALNIGLQVGQRPALAMGNVRSGGDVDMLGYSKGREGPSLQLLIDHDDAKREFSYAEPDGASLAAARAQGFVVVSMKRDWGRVFPAGK